MGIFHNSRQTKYRKPFGAQPCGQEIRLAVSYEGHESPREIDLCYMYGLKGFQSGRIRMEEDLESPESYSCILPLPGLPCLLFYWFELSTHEGVVYCVKDPDSPQGDSQLSNKGPEITVNADIFPHAFQISVYDEDFEVPDSYYESIIYQIFPDRFSRGKDFDLESFKAHGNRDERIYHDSWFEDVDYRGREETGYMALDFFGGSLYGIAENLDYLQALNIDTIYLNPIFQSRSNHRYDTGNYFEVDPMLGSNEAFDYLVKECDSRGIRIILDGVFSHTGADSIYFNKYGNYNSVGAFSDANGRGKSKWYSWYNFYLSHGKIKYESWWGFPDLPNTNENDLTFRKFVLGKGGVVDYWLKRGAGGFRLDVSDELPDDFIQELRKRAKASKKDSVILGEVWEDASNKISYGHFRNHILGQTHDCVMGYPFKNNLLAWLKGHIGLAEAIGNFESIRENYPPQAYLANMNLLGSHDTMRAITDLAGQANTGDRDWESQQTLSYEERQAGLSLLKLAMLVQFTFPGVPSIYYGDEVGMEGYSDPFCRRTLDLEGAKHNPPQLLLWLRALTNFRRERRVLSRGHIEFIPNEDNILLYTRYAVDGKDLLGREFEEFAESGTINKYLVAVNPDPFEKTFVYEGRSFHLGARQGFISDGASKVFEV